MGISVDQFDRQREFDEQNGLGFPLLSDPGRTVAAQFGVTRMARLPNKRATFVIDTDRTILAVIKSETNMHSHADQALAVLEVAEG